MVLILLILMPLKHVIGNESEYKDIKDNQGAYYYYEEIDKIIDDVHRETRQNIYSNKIKPLVDKLKDLEKKKNVAITNLINNYENKILLINQKNELELSAYKLKNSIKKTGLFWAGFSVGVAGSIGTGLIINSFNFPLFNIQF